MYSKIVRWHGCLLLYYKKKKEGYVKAVYVSNLPMLAGLLVAVLVAMLGLAIGCRRLLMRRIL